MSSVPPGITGIYGTGGEFQDGFFPTKNDIFSVSILERRCFFLRILERRNQAHHLHFYILVILAILTRTLALTNWYNIFVRWCHCWTQYLGISDHSCVFENTNMKHHLPGQWVPLVAVFRALVVGTRRVVVRFLNSSTLVSFQPGLNHFKLSEYTWYTLVFNLRQ